MKASFFDTMKSLLPRNRFWQPTEGKFLTKVLRVISRVPDRIARELGLVYDDYFMDTTRGIDDWAKSFSVIFSEMEFPFRRTMMSILWQTANGGQSAFFLQKLLQQLDPKIKVIENSPVGNPRQTTIARMCICGFSETVCGGVHAVCDYREGDTDVTVTVIKNGTSVAYDIPIDPNYWAYCFFVCGGLRRAISGEIVYVEGVEVDARLRSFIEYLILRIKPVHTVAVLAINWVEPPENSIMARRLARKK